VEDDGVLEDEDDDGLEEDEDELEELFGFGLVVVVLGVLASARRLDELPVAVSSQSLICELDEPVSLAELLSVDVLLLVEPCVDREVSRQGCPSAPVRISPVVEFDMLPLVLEFEEPVVVELLVPTSLPVLELEEDGLVLLLLDSEPVLELEGEVDDEEEEDGVEVEDGGVVVCAYAMPAAPNAVAVRINKDLFMTVPLEGDGDSSIP
jgi:hypothetical protein